jgi:hypothetical protein
MGSSILFALSWYWRARLMAACRSPTASVIVVGAATHPLGFNILFLPIFGKSPCNWSASDAIKRKPPELVSNVN